MSAVAYEWGEIEQGRPDGGGVLLRGPWSQDDGPQVRFEPAVAIDRRALMAGRPRSTTRAADVAWDVAVLVVLAALVVGVVLAITRLVAVSSGDYPEHHGPQQVAAAAGVGVSS
ncbi:hypothetical protein [Acidipropionibacterium timonense]|uniref:hypothetical protein n=1 Tax=Acidipropionibacterium timonense TaxID=2161818 RepID=UPI001AEC0A57|nr:hypothetical protein [Acidipropionibacterium timonense]